jgi:hypothetical protein
MTSTSLRGTFGSVASLLAATLYQRNPDRNHELWNIVSTELFSQICIDFCNLKKTFFFSFGDFFLDLMIKIFS